MFEICQVEAHFSPNGIPKPLFIHWNNQKLGVVDYGRRWITEDGLHLLVQVADGRLFELWYNAAVWRAKTDTSPKFV